MYICVQLLVRMHVIDPLRPQESLRGLRAQHPSSCVWAFRHDVTAGSCIVPSGGVTKCSTGSTAPMCWAMWPRNPQRSGQRTEAVAPDSSPPRQTQRPSPGPYPTSAQPGPLTCSTRLPACPTAPTLGCWSLKRATPPRLLRRTVPRAQPAATHRPGCCRCSPSARGASFLPPCCSRLRGALAGPQQQRGHASRPLSSSRNQQSSSTPCTAARSAGPSPGQPSPRAPAAADRGTAPS